MVGLCWYSKGTKRDINHFRGPRVCFGFQGKLKGNQPFWVNTKFENPILGNPLSCVSFRFPWKRTRFGGSTNPIPSRAAQGPAPQLLNGRRRQELEGHEAAHRVPGQTSEKQSEGTDMFGVLFKAQETGNSPNKPRQKDRKQPRSNHEATKREGE